MRSSATTGNASTWASDHLEIIQQQIQRTARRGRLGGEEFEEFRSFCFQKLLQENSRILRRYRGDGCLPSYLQVVIGRLLLDYRTSIWAKWRPSAQARRLGPNAIELEKLTHRDGLPLSSAVECVVRRGVLTGSEAEDLADRLPVRYQRRFESLESLEVLPARDVEPDDALLGPERQQMRNRIETSLSQALQQLDETDRLILCLRYGRRMRVPEISARMGLKERKIFSRCDRSLRCLRKSLEAMGFHRTDIKRVTGTASAELTIDYGAVAPGQR